MTNKSLGAMVLGAAMIGVALIFDQAIAERIALTDDTVLRQVFGMITELGRSHWYLVPSGLLGLVAIGAARFVKAPTWQARGRRVAYCCGLFFGAVALSGIAVNILKPVFGRARPRMLFGESPTYGFEWFRLGSDFASFPSGHTATAISVAVVAAAIWPRWRYALLAGFSLIAVSRVAVNAHFLSDVLAGTILAYAISAALLARFPARDSSDR